MVFGRNTGAQVMQYAQPSKDVRHDPQQAVHTLMLRCKS